MQIQKNNSNNYQQNASFGMIKACPKEFPFYSEKLTMHSLTEFLSPKILIGNSSELKQDLIEIRRLSDIDLFMNPQELKKANELYEESINANKSDKSKQELLFDFIESIGKKLTNHEKKGKLSNNEIEKLIDADAEKQMMEVVG